MTCFVYSVYAINSKVFLVADFYFCRVFLDLDKYIFHWQTCYLGGHLRLELSCIRVNMVWSSYASFFVTGQFREQLFPIHMAQSSVMVC